MNKKVIIGALILVAGTATLYWYQNRATVIVGGDRDKHGCIGSAGYSWCAPKDKCLRIWEEACYKTPAQEIQYILAKKYDKPVSDVTIRVIRQTENHIAGSVSFSTQGRLPEPGESGGFLAVKEDNTWNVVYDGNGSVDCDLLKNTYRFPANILVGFCD